MEAGVGSRKGIQEATHKEELYKYMEGDTRESCR